MIPISPEFCAWCRRYGYRPTPAETEYQREKLARYWLAWQAKVPPDCKRSHAMVQLSGLLASS